MSASPVVTGIGNIILAVRDIERSLVFYRDVLGLDVRFANAGFVYLHAGTLMLCLRHAPAREEDRGDTVEIVFDVADIHASYGALKAHGIEFRVEPRVVTGNLWATDFRDPDGHVLSIFGPSSARGQE
jgi:catechol 2,3-dioxygenase-like lactoylglutathione lyase family enzyme